MDIQKTRPEKHEFKRLAKDC
jgi:hypothetical protein